jgi:DNA-binding GntR family transcriptional regulator
VVAALEANIEASRAAIEDRYTYSGLARDFHVELVAGCGNVTMTVTVGVLESLWTAHVTALGRETDQLGSFADTSVRKVSLREHERIAAAIARGDSRAAERLTREHFAERFGRGGDWRHGFDLDQTVRAGLLSGRR